MPHIRNDTRLIPADRGVPDDLRVFAERLNELGASVTLSNLRTGDPLPPLLGPIDGELLSETIVKLRGNAA